ncbi:DUF6624 domain-containing protein [Streptomyces sp. NPDC015032]|uniref:DUF6624 domain-containing protein n=1 Tax=Streptomyces sp. NPDC015032 TaxID=3364937 RepID=UPI0037019935
MEARCLVWSGRPQRYATQYWLLDGRIGLHPVEDPDDLDRRRACAGLPPYRDQIARLEQHHLRAPAAPASI